MTRDPEKPKHPETYMHDYNGTLTRKIIAGRTADLHGAFFLPYLRPIMTLLDCGCGPGTITAGFAQVISQGEVTGIDLEESQFAPGRRSAAALGLANLTLEQGNVYDLVYQDATFDAVFSHAMLEHLRDPVTILKEMYRVLKPGGIIGLRSIDLAATLIAPDDGTLMKGHDLWLKYRRHCGGDPFMGRRLKALLREAGFARTIGTASSEGWGMPEQMQAIVSSFTAEFTGPAIAETAVKLGWCDLSEIGQIRQALRNWGDNPDAFMAITWCEAVGWKE